MNDNDKHIPHIPYFQTTRIRVAAMVELAHVKPGEQIADLGAGDGRVAIAFAKAGAYVTAFEIDEDLAKLAEENIQKENLLGKIELKQTDFWNENLSDFDVVAVYPFPDIMEELEKKMKRELKPGARIVLNFYPFSSWQPEKIKEKIYLFRKI